MFPIRDHNPSERTPIVTYVLIAINLVVFAGYFLPNYDDPRALNEFFMTWGLVPALSGEDHIPFITSMFLHGGVMHLGGNMLFLWIFGDNLEDEMGHVGFLLFYLASGIGAASFRSWPTLQAPCLWSEPQAPSRALWGDICSYSRKPKLISC
jgi:membrane associated rhomboid family serine protease